MTHPVSPAEDERDLLILYASQTGTAQDVAERIGREARRRHFRARVLPMDQYDRSRLIGERYLICIAATTGQGDEPTNMRSFWKALRQSSLPSDFLSEVEFTTFGLGDSTYPKYNWTAKKLHRRLEQLGATEFHERGEGDEQNHNGFVAPLFDRKSASSPLDAVWIRLLIHGSRVYGPNFSLGTLCGMGPTYCRQQCDLRRGYGCSPHLRPSRQHRLTSELHQLQALCWRE